MLTNKDRVSYLNAVKDFMIKKYEMPKKSADEAIENSVIKKIVFNNDKDIACIQMCDPIELVSNYVYCEYHGMPDEYLRTLL